jgi:hypothetical protein
MGKHFDPIIPQLDHLSLNYLHETDLEHLLLLSTSLQSLRCRYNNSVEGCSKVIDQISRIDAKELQFDWRLVHQNSDNWETDFESIEKFKKVVERKDELKRVELDFTFNDYSQRPSQNVCDQAFSRWKAIKDELELICVKQGIEVVTLSCDFFHGYEPLWDK